MIIPSKLLPVESTTVWEKVMADVMNGGQILPDQIDLIRGAKLVSPPPSLLPFLIYEYGLGELTPYVPNLYQLIDEGIQWQRIRGTPKAIEMGLEWIDYTAILEEAPKTWRYWNTFQLQLDRVRDERADLDRINGIADLSPPKRSKFWRGFSGYDARPLIWGMGTWGGNTWSEYSGVRVKTGGPLWSFGRNQYEFDTTISREDLEEIDAWIEPDWTQYSGSLGWDDFEWGATEATWETGTSETHANALAAEIFGRPVWVAFMELNGTIIGYRRARAYHYVIPQAGGEYVVQGLPLKISSDVGPTIYIEALTGFGDGNGRTARYVGLCFDGTLSPANAGLRWATPAQLTGVTDPVAIKDVNIPMGESIRERVKYALRLDGAYDLPLAMVALGETPVGVNVDFADDSYAERY